MILKHKSITFNDVYSGSGGNLHPDWFSGSLDMMNYMMGGGPVSESMQKHLLDKMKSVGKGLA